MSDNDYYKMLAEQLAKGLEETKRIAQNLQADVTTMAIKQAGMEADVKSMHATVDALNKIIRDGNGEKPLMSRILILENQSESFKKAQEDTKKDKSNVDTENTRGKWMMRVAFITGGISLVVCIANMIVTFIK